MLFSNSQIQNPKPKIRNRSTISVNKCWRIFLSLLLLSPLAHCSSKKVTYYKPGGNQSQFDLDSKGCFERAEMRARSKMANPEAKPDPNLVQEYYEECLYVQGWGKVPLDKRDRALWKWKGRNLYFEQFTMELPSGFSLRTQSKWIIGPTWSHQLQAAGSGEKTWLILLAQESIEDPIQIIGFPLPEGFALYTGGRLDKFDIRWSVFTGRYQQNLVGMLGAYIYLEKTRRISVVFSHSLSASGPAVRGYALSISQKKELDELYSDWVSWIKTQTGAKEIEEKAGLRRYFRFIW